MTSNSFDVIVVTATNPYQQNVFQKEIEMRRNIHPAISSLTKITALADPKGIRIGSGGLSYIYI